MRDGLFPLLRRDDARAADARALVLSSRGEAQRMGEPADLGRTRAGAQQCELDQAREVARLLRRQAEEREVMAQQGGERLGREILQQRLRAAG